MKGGGYIAKQTNQSIHSAFHRYVARSGVKVPIHAHHGLHSLRATVATKLLSADVSPDIMEPRRVANVLQPSAHLLNTCR